MMVAIGTANVEQSRITMSLGTSGTIYAYVDQPCVDRDGLIAGVCSSTNGWLPLICTMKATNVIGLIQSLTGQKLSDFDQ